MGVSVHVCMYVYVALFFSMLKLFVLLSSCAQVCSFYGTAPIQTDLFRCVCHWYEIRNTPTQHRNN
jgi:hypothetical protein